MEVNNYASKGAAATGIALGASGLGVAALNALSPGGVLSGLFGGNCGQGCHENMAVNRYELGLEQTIASKDSKIALLESTINTDGKMLQLYQYVDGRLRGIESQVAQQAVVNAQIMASQSCMQGNIATLMGLTKTIVPATSICPEPMPQYNSWTAPTAPATGA